MLTRSEALNVSVHSVQVLSHTKFLKDMFYSADKMHQRYDLCERGQLFSRLLNTQLIVIRL
jgi:hypothetical protein